MMTQSIMFASENIDELLEIRYLLTQLFINRVKNVTT